MGGRVSSGPDFSNIYKALKRRAMQSQIQTHTESNPVTTSTSEQQLSTAAQPQQSESDAQSQESRSAAPTETEMVMTPEKCQTGEQNAEISANMDVTELVESPPGVQTHTESCEDTGKMDRDSTAMSSAPAELVAGTSTNPACDGQKTKKQERGVSDGRKYVPSKKAMIDPLKMDMSKPVVIPLTSSQLSLQCIECHIIFSDHKSKERHLKLSHPAEYEQCILRNALFACYVCDRHFTNSTELMAHQKAHIEKKPFKCPICGLAYKKSSELTVHKKVHFGQDGYACTDCGKTCKTLTLLRYHQRTHTGERPYVCKECGKRFTMSKALQKHTVAHLQEGEAIEGSAKKELQKNDGTTRYPCSSCKATFKSLKTRLHHMKTKHNNSANNVFPAAQLGKQSAPIITPISIAQPTLLQVEPNGPLQKVDANIDTEQIRKLIESLGNVQKVNQVVILGQVPPHAPPLQVQQLSQPLEPLSLNLTPPQIDFIGLKQTDCKDVEVDPLNNPCDSMEQTIILEPITPDGQLDNPSFSGLGPHVAACENIELMLVEAEQTERPEGEVMPLILQQPDISAVTSDLLVCQNEVENLKENLEQTVILELTPALIPTLELEQSQTEPQNEITSSSLVLSTDQETLETQTADQTVIDEQETSLSVPLLMSIVELELTPLNPEQQDLSSCPFAPPDAFTEGPSESETNSKQDIDSHAKTAGVDQIPEKDEKTQEQIEQDVSENLPIESKNNTCEVEEPSAEEEAPSLLQTKPVPQNSELPINVMSAQELVKVRKRKPARTFIFQGYMQDFVGSIYKDDFQINATPAKRQRAKKSHLVVKFGPQSKDKKSKKQKKPTQKGQPIQRKTPTKKRSEKKVASQNKGGKGKKNKTKGNVVSGGTDNKSPSTQTPQVQQINEDKGKSKMKKQKVAKEGGAHTSEHKSFAPPMFKKKKQAKILQKDQPNNVKSGKAKKNLARDEKVKTANVPGPHITEDSLLLLKGHKQPQLKVYKLDPSKASGQTPEASPSESQAGSHHSTTESTNELSLEGKKKGGKAKKNQKALSLLSSLKVSHEPSETLLTKPKTTRKRKSSSKVETEGVITSKRALECKDCGERFSDVSCLQKHKMSAHIVESPSLTYTNGNIFEGVSRLDLYQLPKAHEKVVHAMNAATDWDIEPETGEMALEDRERSVSFPALIPSPSLHIPPQDVEMSSYEDKGRSKTGSDIQSDASTNVLLPSDVVKSTEAQQNVSSEATSLTSTQTGISETGGGPLTSDEDKQEEDAAKTPGSESEVHGTKDEDIKEDLLLEVDLVTVGEQNEKEDPVSIADTAPQNEPDRSCNFESGSPNKCSEQVSDGTTERSLTSQNVSCSTHEVEVKEEEEETVVQKRKEGGKGVRNSPKGRKRGPVHLKRDATSKKSSVRDAARGTESENDQDCRVVYEKHPLSSETMAHEISTRSPTSHELEAIKAPGTSLPSIPSPLEESNGEPVVFELESLTTSVEEVMKERGLEGGEENDRETDQSPGIILERFLTSRQSAATDEEMCLVSGRSNQKQGLDRVSEDEVQVLGSQEIKVEESSSDPLLVASTCQNRQRASVQTQHHRDIRTVLVKEETSSMVNDAQLVHQGSKRMQWNLEPVSNEKTDIPFMECGETRDRRVSPEFSSNQCIFYPVKEEEREVLLGAAQTNGGSSTPQGSGDANQTEHQTADCDACEGRHSAPDYQETLVRGLSSEPGVTDFAERQASDSEWQNPSDIRDFLLQSFDEKDTSGFELSDPHVDTEADVMACFNNSKTSSGQQPDQTSPSVPTSMSWLQSSNQENTTRKPIDHFSKYFGWDTWVSIATCTNKLSKMPNPVTCREVARFVGIHIAMGTLKFPSPRLYWDDFTKVPLIAEAIPLNRFLELSRTLRLTSPSDNPNSRSVDSQQEGEACSSSQGVISQHDDRQCQGSNENHFAQADPLWKVQSLLRHFNTGCQPLTQHADYAIDQYSLPLTSKVSDNRPSLLCTTLIGFGGLLSHVDLKLDLSDKEDAVEKVAPTGSMVFLCKQELSTPAMLERLLTVGVHAAGRVGGARGQIGDEFVSSDGKLMLRRSHRGFILSTAGNNQRNIASLMESFETAQMSARLNRDLLNLYSIPLMASAPTCWPQAVLWYLIDAALVNSWLLYRQDNRAVSEPLTLMAFRLEVSKALILSSSSDTQDSIPPQPPSENAHATSETPNPILLEESPLPDAATRYDGSGHWPEQLTEGEGGRCRFGDCHRTSRVLCLKCCVFLCISRNHNCFLNFHNQGSLEKE